MLAAATSFFARTAISQSYNFGDPSATGSRSSTPGPASTSNSPQTLSVSLHIGLWKVQGAYHKVTNKRVAVWSFDKRGPETERLGPLSKERILEVLKGEASALGRLRHPSILEMVEPLEETRSELIFATEPILSSLDMSIPGSSRFRPWVELDEVEIQKGILQICKGLSFLHTSAQLIHSNICPESIIINSAGDWKISGLGLTIPLLQLNGSPTRWEFPTFDGRVPSYIQRSFDYMAPEYALDEVLITASDMFSLGVVLYAVHCKGQTPFQTHGSLAGLRENAGRALPGMERLDDDLKGLLRSLITRHSNNRPTPTTLPSHPFFSSLPISTLNFLDRSNFTAKTREEKVGFMKGLTGVLDKFSEGLRTRKMLPSLLEEMKDTHLLPYILPNVFAIATALSAPQFASMVLPSLKPLFAVKEPPQNMLTLLDNLSMLQGKTDKSVFRGEVLPLVYNALESEHAIVQERALKIIPDLCDTIDYAEVQGVMFPRVALVFSKTRILTVKVATLETFLAMVKTLDQTSLTQKLVPLLSKIRTKEPAVMTATLAVQEAMGFKVDREAVATLVLPQLWAMSMGPLLNVEQFQRFMDVIKRLGDRVEKEHNQFLRDSQRLEDRSGVAVNGNGTNPHSFAGAVDFESLVGGAGAAAPTGTSTSTKKQSSNASWDDDVWGSIFSDETSGTHSPALSPAAPPPQATLPASPSSPRTIQGSRLGAKSIPAASFSSASFPSPPSNRSFSNPLRPTNTGGFPPSPQPQKPNYNISLSTSTMSPMRPTNTGGFPPPAQPQKPNYNIQFSTPAPTMSALQNPILPASSPPPSLFPTQTPAMLTPLNPTMTMGNILAPSKPAQPSWSTSDSKSNIDWGDFDPLT
ncbi:other/SCY1 protein kinase [Guyanagaster necrorhizus]|uniref:Other/SCY1 protein kinase n=1 Tax=Guyanagaster necrorhizus TaxID=856835 RepID=A0A9P7W555_9AGAR|nr:other/SCY1 protein kinase [Guyanagaster necrorhizus MCA 3950]KAG7452863.1 other/SCY1 protein kinase [Guyanagaster necrorhizus MCA 3950]